MPKTAPQMGNSLLSRATPEHLPAILALLSSCVQSMLDAGIEQWDEIYPDEETLRSDIVREELWIARGPALVGCISINSVQSPEYSAIPWQHPAESAIVFHRLMVAAEFQGRGHGRQIMKSAEEIARASGAKSIRLDAFLHNPAAMRLYDVLGYSRMGTVQFRKGPFACFEKSLDTGA